MIVAGYQPYVGSGAGKDKEKEQETTDQIRQETAATMYPNAPNMPNMPTGGTSTGGVHIAGNMVNTGMSSHLNGNVINNAAYWDGAYDDKNPVDDEGVVVMSPVSAPSVDMPTSSVGGTSSASGSSVPAPSGGNKTSSSPTIEEFYDDEGEDLENQTSGETDGETDGETGDGEDDEAFADLDRVIDELLNFKYKDFSYDPLSDPTYLQYQKQYQRNAQAAMENAAALAATRTGGYGNSYASVASQQAYDAQMDELNDILPRLYEQAYSRHQTEESQRLQQLLNEYAVLSGEREYATGREDVAWERDFKERGYSDEQAAAKAEEMQGYFVTAVSMMEEGQSSDTVRAYLIGMGADEADADSVMDRVQTFWDGGYGDYWAGKRAELDAEDAKAVKQEIAGLVLDLYNDGMTAAEIQSVLVNVHGYDKTMVSEVVGSLDSYYNRVQSNTEEEAYKQQVSAWLDAAGKGNLSVSQRDQILGMRESGEMPQPDFDKIMDAYSSTVKTELSSGYVFVDEYGDWMVGSDAKSMVEEAMKDKFLSEEVKKRLAKKYNDKYAIYKCVYWNDGNPQPWNAEYSSFGIVLTYGDDEYEMKTIRVTDDDDVILAAAELDDMTVFMKGDTLYVKEDNGKIYELESDNWDASEVKSLLKGKYKEFYTGVNYG